MNLNYKWIGHLDSKRIILFLHEGLGSIKLWKKFPELLCEATNSAGLLYDRSGYGESPGDLSNRSVDYLHKAADELSHLILTSDGNGIFPVLTMNLT